MWYVMASDIVYQPLVEVIQIMMTIVTNMTLAYLSLSQGLSFPNV